MRQRIPLTPFFFYLIFSLLCTRIPLLHYLGYEFSAVLALVCSFISGFLTIANVKRAMRGETNWAFAAKEAFWRSIGAGLSLLIVPLIVMTTNALFVRNCSLSNGVLFFFLLPMVSFWFSCCVGFFCAVHYRWSKVMFTAIFLGTIFYAAALGYFTPAIYSYNFFYGFFPGVTYDEVLGMSWSLVFFRVITVFLGGVILWMGFLIVDCSRANDTTMSKGLSLLRSVFDRRHRWLTVGICTMLAGLYFARCDLGFESTGGFIQEQLGKKVETEHFAIYYSSESYSEEEVQWMAAGHEFRLHQLMAALSLASHGRLESYIYPSAAVKQKLMGAGATNIAKPWSKQIHLTKQSLDGTLKHELAHVVTGQFGMPVIDANLSTGLVEGLAMALEWEWGNRTLHQYAAAMRKFGVLPDINELMTPAGFAAQASSVSYVVAGSFCRFLVDRYGIRLMMLLYRSGDYAAVYGRDLDELIQQWIGFLDRVQVWEQDRDAVDVLFRGSPIFKKVCARVVAGRNVKAGEAFADRNYVYAANLYKQSYDEGRGYDALSGYVASGLRAGDFAAVTSVLDTIILRDPHPAQFLPLFVNIGIAHWAEGNPQKAQELFARVACAGLQENLTETALVCSAAIGDSMNHKMLLGYLLSAPADTQRLVLLDSMLQDTSAHWLPLYLKGRVLTRLQRWDKALDIFQQLDGHNPVTHLAGLQSHAFGFVLFRMKRFEEAKAAFWTSLNYISTEVARNDVNEWIARCEWMEQYGLP